MTGTGVVVLGMHRSGTSAVTRTVNLLGVPTCVPGDLNRDRTANLRGHWESATLVRLNEELLRAAGGAWWCPPPPDTDWDVIAGDRMADAAAAFERAHPTPSWVCKDPRTCVTAPFWQQALPQRLVYLLAVRHPLAVAASLTARNALTTAAGLAIWEGYMSRAARAATGSATIVSCFEAMVADPLAWAHELRDFLLAAGVERPDTGCPERAARSVERSLVHHAAPDVQDGLSDEQAGLFAELRRCTGSHAAFAPSLPAATPSTEALLASQRHRLLSPAQPLATPIPPPTIPLLHPRPRGPVKGPSIGIVLAPRRAGAPVGDTLRTLLAAAPPSVEIVAVGAPGAPSDPRVTTVPAPDADGGRVAVIAACLEHLDTEFVAVCDAGVQPDPCSLEALTDVVRRSDVGAAGPALLGRAGEAVHGLTLRGPCLNAAWIIAAPSADPFPVAAVPATMMMLRRDVLEAIGGFDPGMTGYGGEDTELCVRLWRAGYVCLTVPRARAVLGSHDGQAHPPDATGVLQNRLRLGLLHLSSPRLGHFIEQFRRSPEFPEAFARVMSDDIADRRVLIDALACFDDAWLLRRFNVGALPTLRAEYSATVRAPRVGQADDCTTADPPRWTPDIHGPVRSDALLGPVPTARGGRIDAAREACAVAGSQDDRPPNPDAPTVRYSIAVDGPPRFRRQAVAWLATGAALGGVAPEQVLVQCTETVPDDFRRGVARTYGVNVVALPAPSTQEGALNKLRQLDSPDLEAEWIVLCDCDIVFAEPLPETEFRPGLSAKLVDVGFPALPVWSDLLGRLGLGPGRPPARLAAKGGGATYRNNCNGGLYIGDRSTWASIAPHWRWAAAGLPTWMNTPNWAHHYDQIAFGVACASSNLDVHLLPRRLNFPLHENPTMATDIRPALLHHHQLLDGGRITCRPGHDDCPGVLAAVGRVNDVLRRVRWERFGL